MSTKIFKKRSKKIGMPPGTLVHVGEKKVDQVRLTVIDYDEEQIIRRELGSVEESLPFRDSATVSWLNIYGLHEPEILEKIGNYFGIHPLSMEDVLNTDQRPKLEVFDDYLFLVLKMIALDESSGDLNIEQISIILGHNFVITVQERPGDVFTPLRKRLQEGVGRLRKRGADYLFYSIIDIIVDHYFLVLEIMGERIERLDEMVIDNTSAEIAQEIKMLKREILLLRKQILPLRDVLSSLNREEFSFIQPETGPFLRDLYDHQLQVVEALESYRDMLNGIMDIYFSNLSNRMNEVMKVLTIIATIFIPLTFIAGIYGMNFEHMPELEWPWAYPAVWGIMMVVAAGMLYFFRKRKWL